jgi:hypothetical protein
LKIRLLWHPFLFLGLRLFSLFFFLLWSPILFLVKKQYLKLGCISYKSAARDVRVRYMYYVISTDPHILTVVFHLNLFILILTKTMEASKQKEERGENLSPRDRKAYHSVSTALLKSVAEIGTQSTMKSGKKTLHEFTLNIPPKRRKGT